MVACTFEPVPDPAVDPVDPVDPVELVDPVEPVDEPVTPDGEVPDEPPDDSSAAVRARSS